MRRDPGGRALYRSRTARRRRSLLVVVLLVMAVLAAVLVARGSHAAVTVTYDRAAAVRYADAWALRHNPAYWSSQTDDCADFVSQCVAAGGLRALDGPDGGWHANGTGFPTVAWVNCGRQQGLWSTAAADHTPYIVQRSAHLPAGWRRGDVVYLGARVQGRPVWQHVVICAGKRHGHWVYDSHTTAHRHVTMGHFYPAHFSLICYCRIADRVVFR
jgi:hypothetical protein